MDSTIDRLTASLEGRYRVERELGAGGMATVYLAHDLKHDRKVAVKVLKPELAAVVGSERFLAEIRTTANLQHPHILPLFDSGEADGFLFFVMPYVEGESLRDRLDREGELPVEDAVRIATAVASALDYAHRRGVIHRDIKPANILLHDGQPLVADFGIALAVSAAGGGRLTETGLSLGTPYYMSPEQATAERDPDPRSDVYALGCVLYEMLVGEPPYTGATAQAVLGKILTTDPVRPTEHRRTVPPNVEVAVLKALEKRPADRFGSAAELAAALGDPGFRLGPGDISPGPAAHPGSWRSTAGLGGLAAVLGALALWGWLRPVTLPSPVPQTVRASLSDIEVRAAMNSGVRVAISHDGSHIAVAQFVGEVSKLFVRRADQTGFREIEGTDGAEHPSFSPDGEWIAFMQRPIGALGQGQIRRVRVTGGPTSAVTEGEYPHWARDETIVFEKSDGIYTVSPGGEEVVRIVEGRQGNAWPHMLPGGRAVLFKRDLPSGRTIFIADLSTGEVTDLGLRGGNPQYLPTGHLVYGHESQALMAVPFDLESLQLTGEPSVVLPDVLVYDGGATQFAVSDQGTAIYGLPGPTGIRTRDLVVRDADGAVNLTPLGEGQFRLPRFSPDGRWISYEKDGGIWTFDRTMGRTTELTADGDGLFPTAWSWDGRYVFFGGPRDPEWGVDAFRKASDGSGNAEALGLREGDQYPLSVTRDGGYVLLGELSEERGWDLIVAMEKGEDLVYEDFLSAPWNEMMGTFSPDGSWVAYVSNESGEYEVHVRSFPDGENHVKISDGVGTEPRWAPDGSAIYYRSGRQVVRVSFEGGRPGSHEVLFEGNWTTAAFGGLPVMTNWDIDPGGDQFVLVRNPRLASGSEYPALPLEVAVNWFSELERMVPVR